MISEIMRKPTRYYKQDIEVYSLAEKKQLFCFFLSQKVFAIPLSLERSLEKEDYPYFRTRMLSLKFKNASSKNDIRPFEEHPSNTSRRSVY